MNSILEQLKRRVADLEERLSTDGALNADRIAVFDLDGTLLEGDIGEAVFAYLLHQGQQLGWTWEDYQRTLRTHKARAYRAVVEAMAGMEVEAVREATRSVMSLEKTNLALHSSPVRTPKPRTLFVELVSFLAHLQYRIYVISASNHISVQHIVGEWFDIPRSRAFGIETRIINGRLTSELIEPVPIGIGKADLYKRFEGRNKPLITATDSRIDSPLLHLTHTEGLSIWVGENQLDFDVVMERASNGQQICVVGTEEESKTDQY
jgi:phosphoserine phosphatase